MSHYKPYPAYKDSGVEWIEKVPEHWKAVKIARVGLLSKANGGSKQDNTDTGIPCIRYGDLYTTHEYVIRGSRSYIGADRIGEYTSICYGDALFAASGETFEDIGRSAVNLLRKEACCGGDVIVLRPTIDLDPLFLGYALDSMPSKAQKTLMGKGYTVVHIYADQLRDLIVALPPPSEQESIGAALARETARIDALIAKKTEFIELLSKKRQALITHAVTKGLNPEAKMKDSGVEWIGEVPEHWEVRRMATLFREAIRPGNPALPILSISIHDGITDDELAPEDRDRRISQIEDKTKYKRVVPGDLAYNMMRAWQGAFGAVTVDGLVSPAYVVAEPGGDFRTGYIEHLLRTPMAIEEMRRHSRGIADFRMRLYWDYFRDIKVCLPPKDEQDVILDRIIRETSRIDLLSEKTQHSIDLLKKRRSALITAAVTGQIDLRESV